MYQVWVVQQYNHGLHNYSVAVIVRYYYIEYISFCNAISMAMLRQV